MYYSVYIIIFHIFFDLTAIGNWKAIGPDTAAKPPRLPNDEEIFVERLLAKEDQHRHQHVVLRAPPPETEAPRSIVYISYL